MSQPITSAGAPRRQVRTYTINLPAHWAAALVNNDWSTLDAGQTDELKHYLSMNPDHAAALSCSAESFEGIFQGHWHKLLAYTFAKGVF
jgi:hypothetical protein